MDEALQKVIQTLGNPEECGVKERRMKEVLWDSHFDAPVAINTLIEEKQREEAHARKRAGTYLLPHRHVVVQRVVGLTSRCGSASDWDTELAESALFTIASDEHPAREE